MAAATKRILLWLGIAFVIYTVIASPSKAADATREVFDALHVVAGSLGTFFDALV